MKIIKVSAGSKKKAHLLLRHTFNQEGLWGNCRFIVNEKVERCDWWFVLHGSGLLREEKCICDPDHIVYVSMEPNENISGVHQDFLSQFSCIVTCDRSVKHDKKIYENWLTWWVGINIQKIRNKHKFLSRVRFGYDELVLMSPERKINKVSVIVSDKTYTDGHLLRLQFIESLANSEISKYIDIFGHGFNEIPDKWDAISPYKYHLVLENSITKDYWSEKLADAFLGFSFPIYSGCPNINKFFNIDSLEVIDINRHEDAIFAIKSIIQNDVYSKKIEQIKDSRDKILFEYNIFNLMSKLATKTARKYEKVKLRQNSFYIDSYLKRIIRKLFNFFHHG